MNPYRSGLEKCQELMDQGARQNADILLIGDAEETPTEENRIWFEEYSLWLRRTETRQFSIHICAAKDPLVDILRAISREVLVIEELPENIPADVLAELEKFVPL